MSRRVPRPLLLLLAGVAVTALAWALVVPPFQVPDENSHFSYEQSLVERGDLPGDPVRKLFSTEQEQAASFSNSDQTAMIRATKPEWSKEVFDRWKESEGVLPASAHKDAGGPTPSSTNPPLYYLYLAPAYLISRTGDVFERLYVMRLWSIVLLLVTTTGAWLLAGELFGRDRLLQLVAAGVAGLQPMVVFISSAVNPDAMLFALWSMVLWLGVRILKRGLDAPSATALFAAVGLAVVTKATSYALLPGALVVLTVGLARRRQVLSGGTAMIAAAAFLAFAVPAGSWLVTARILDRPAINQVNTVPGHPSPTLTSFGARDLGSYLWQFYLPRLPFQSRFRGLARIPVYSVWLKQGWAAFGWLEVKFPRLVYIVLGLLTLTAFAGAGMLLARNWARVDPAALVFVASVVISLLAGLHWTEFRTLIGGSGSFIQGRYLLPLIPLGGAAVAATVALLPTNRRLAATAIVFGGLFSLQLFSLAIVGARFYA